MYRKRNMQTHTHTHTLHSTSLKTHGNLVYLETGRRGGSRAKPRWSIGSGVGGGHKTGERWMKIELENKRMRERK